MFLSETLPISRRTGRNAVPDRKPRETARPVRVSHAGSRETSEHGRDRVPADAVLGDVNNETIGHANLKNRSERTESLKRK